MVGKDEAALFFWRIRAGRLEPTSSDPARVRPVAPTLLLERLQLLLTRVTGLGVLTALLLSDWLVLLLLLGQEEVRPQV